MPKRKNSNTTSDARKNGSMGITAGGGPVYPGTTYSPQDTEVDQSQLTRVHPTLAAMTPSERR